MEEVNTLSALAGCLDPSTPTCVCPCTFDDDVGGGGGGVNNHESLNIVLKLLITPLYAQVRAARVKKWLSDVFVPSCCAIPWHPVVSCIKKIFNFLNWGELGRHKVGAEYRIYKS